MGGRPGRGRAGFGPAVGFRAGTGTYNRGRGANRDAGGDFGVSRGIGGPRPNYSGRYSYDRRCLNYAKFFPFKILHLNYFLNQQFFSELYMMSNNGVRSIKDLLSLIMSI